MQYRPTKLVDGFHHMSCSERPKKLNLTSLIEIFKYFHFYDNCTLAENLRPRNRPSRKHDYHLVWKAPKDGVRGLQANFFYFRTIKASNELPKEIVNARSIDSFKNKLDEAWKDLPMKFYEQERFIEALIYLRICNSWIVTRKATGFKSRRLSCSDITQVNIKMRNVDYC